jgi:uncharacterized protein Usg
MRSISLQLKGYRLITAEILYHLPDYPKLLQAYIWQAFDLAPRYPALHQFLDFWSHNLDGKLYSVRVAHAEPMALPRLRHAAVSLAIH